MTGAGYTGTVGGIAFKDGLVVVGDPPVTGDQRAARSLVGYFRRHGYELDTDGRVVSSTSDDPESPDPRKVGTDGDGIEVVGTKLRDASVDPKPDDFLAPTNAGEANPHGPDVVAPGVHAAETGIITPGPVSNDTERQDGLETAVAGASLVEGRDVGEVTAQAAAANPTPEGVTDGATVTGLQVDQDLEVVQPKGNASHDLWVEYAVAQGAPRGQVEPLTRDEIRDRYQA